MFKYRNSTSTGIAYPVLIVFRNKCFISVLLPLPASPIIVTALEFSNILATLFVSITSSSFFYFKG